MKTLIITQAYLDISDIEVFQVINTQVHDILNSLKSQTFESIKTNGQVHINELENKDFWKNAFSVLQDGGQLELHTDAASNEEVVASLLKMNGFSSVTLNSGVISGQKPKWQATGASLKRNPKPVAQTSLNPWANLSNQDGALINEDALMKDEIDTKVVGKFCGDDDKIKAGKPCANCTCGRKEAEEGKITEQDLEVGNVVSDCGKCYLGDAFRCGTCPYLGQPAFEPGDKVKLSNASVAQTKTESEDVKVQTKGNKVVLLDI